ncbi:MAG: hypothetical protein HY744_10800 [Deltaproteobacteria bacterium]|nr:hypothetical protein [Deltaproteobacteria bacterium]
MPSVVRTAPLLLLTASLSAAPYQCASEPDAAHAIEETPGEAIYKLAEQYRAAGNREAWLGALRFLVQNYPSSRFAEAARLDLAAATADGGP